MGKGNKVKPVTRRTVVKTQKPVKAGAVWSDRLGAFYPEAWLT